MKTLHLSTDDVQGGAAIAAHRTHLGLIDQGVISQMFVLRKKSDSDLIEGPRTKAEKALAKVRPRLDRLPLMFFPQRDRDSLFSLGWTPRFLQKSLKNFDADLLHVHWMCSGFQRVEDLAADPRPQVWTMHDMWAFTGGCHYSGQCENYREQCNACPMIRSGLAKGPAHWVWSRKREALANSKIAFVAPSRWLAKCAGFSSILRGKKIHVIPNGLDLSRYIPAEQGFARGILGLPLNKKLILFGAMNATSDPRKGFQYLRAALERLKELPISGQVELVVFGASRPEKPLNLGLPIHYLGRITDDINLALLYAACDVFVAPSVQDNLPNTVVESLACGTPCVAFSVGGMPDLIDSGENGFLAKPFDSADLAHGIEETLGNTNGSKKMRVSARTKAETHFDIRLSSSRYLDLYRELGASKTLG